MINFLNSFGLHSVLQGLSAFTKFQWLMLAQNFKIFLVYTRCRKDFHLKISSMDWHCYLSMKFCYLTNYQLKLSVMPIYESSKSSCKLESNLISFGTLYSIHDQPDSLTWVTCDSILKNLAILVLWKSTDLLQKQENSYTVKKYKKYARNSETIFWNILVRLYFIDWYNLFYFA